MAANTHAKQGYLSPSGSTLELSRSHTTLAYRPRLLTHLKFGTGFRCQLCQKQQKLDVKWENRVSARQWPFSGWCVDMCKLTQLCQSGCVERAPQGPGSLACET